MGKSEISGSRGSLDSRTIAAVDKEPELKVDAGQMAIQNILVNMSNNYLGF